MTKLTRQKHAKKYSEYVCSQCGKPANNRYTEPYRSLMLQRQLCFTCNYWYDFELKLEREHERLTIIGGHVYSPGNRTSGSFRGMAGRRFDIEYIEPSVYAGQRVTTFDLWAGSAMPERLQKRFCDTAKFLGGAEKTQVGKTTCWNDSGAGDKPYPLPASLRPRQL